MEFRTIHPGWYYARAIRIHMKVHVDGRDVYTGQLYFPEEYNRSVTLLPPYREHTTLERMPNELDPIFQMGTGRQTTLAVEKVSPGQTRARVQDVDHCGDRSPIGTARACGFGPAHVKEIAVEGDGPGIPVDDLERVFARYYRGMTRERSEIHGTGLGLTITRMIVKGHGGRIRCSGQVRAL